MNPELAIKSPLEVAGSDNVGDFIEKATQFMLDKHGSYELHDPIAAYAAVNPGAFEFLNGRINVDGNGVTSIDETVKSKHRIATGINPGIYHREIIDIIYQ
jgi:inosine-uridine nucleoside N-ribohydrolase